MAQNTSTAVMQRRNEPHDSLDFFPTPPWATRALCEWIDRSIDPASETVWEPACGAGHMAKTLAEYFGKVRASDIHDYGYGEIDDFLLPRPDPGAWRWIITNPPFRLAAEFCQRATQYSKYGVAMLVRSAFLEGKERYETLFKPNPPSIILQFVERVPMVKGRCPADATTATSYSWIVWRKSMFEQSTVFGWIPPCRKRLEREGDYD